MQGRKLVVILVSILVIIFILTGILVKITPKERCERKYSEFEDLYTEKLYQGYNLSEAEDIAKKAKEAYNKGDYESAMRFLDEAIIALEKAKKAAPIMLPVTWTEEEYTEYFIQNFLNLALPPLTKGQMQLIIDDKSLKQKTVKELKGAQAHYTDKDVETIKLGSLAGEKEKALEAVSNVTNSITQLRRDINADKNVDVIHSDYNMLRSALIQEYQLQQDLRKKFEPVYDAFIRKYRPEEYHPVKFSVYINYPSYEYIYKHSTGEIINQVSIVSKTGVDMIRIDILYDMFLNNDTETIQKLDRAVEEIRKQNKGVYIAIYGEKESFTGNPDSETWKGHFGSMEWPLWRQTYLDQVRTIMIRYNPEYVNLLGEAPSWMQAQVSELVTVDQWVELTEEAASLVKQLNPSTYVVVDTALPHPFNNHANIRWYKQLVARDNEIDAFGLDIYGLQGFQYYKENEDLLQIAKEYKRDIWIGQTWDDIHGKYFCNVSEKFITGSVYWAESNDIKGYGLFFGHRLHTKDFEPTPAFFTYKMVIEEVHNNTISTQRALNS